MRSIVGSLLVLAAWGGLAGESLAQRQPGFPGGPGLGGMGMTLPIRTLLASSKALQEELKLTEEQIEVFQDLQKKEFEAMRLGGGFGFGGSDEEQIERLKQQIKRIEDRMATINKTLNKEQLKRLQQIENQQLGMAAFTNPRVQKELKLSDEQKEKLKSINEDMNKEMREIQQDAFKGGFDRDKLQEVQKKMASLREEAQEQMEKVLTDDQVKAWKDMLGEKFDTSKLMPMFPGFPPKN